MFNYGFVLCRRQIEESGGSAEKRLRATSPVYNPTSPKWSPDSPDPETSGQDNEGLSDVSTETASEYEPGQEPIDLSIETKDELPPIESFKGLPIYAAAKSTVNGFYTPVIDLN